MANGLIFEVGDRVLTDVLDAHTDDGGEHQQAIDQATPVLGLGRIGGIEV